MQATSAIKANQGRYLYAGFTNSGTATTLDITQSVNIDVGTQISIGGWVNVLGASNSKTAKATLFFDGIQQDTQTFTTNTNGVYQKLASSSSFLVTLPGKIHEFKLRIEVNSYNSGSSTPVFVADDFYLNAVSGPGNAPLCSVPSTTPIVPTPTPTPSATCYTATTTNYVTNPGFESHTGALQTTDAWKLTASSAQWTSNTKVVTGTTYAHSGNNGFIGFSNADTATLTLEQTVTIPAGVTFKVGLWFKSLRAIPTPDNKTPFSVVLKVGGVQVATWNPNNKDWKELVPTMVPNSFVAGSSTTSRTVSIVVTSTIPGDQLIFAVDDFYVTAISGPNNLPVCGSVSSTPAAPRI